MNVIKIIVDKLPNSCRDCGFYCKLSKHCHALDDMPIENVDRRFIYCPLQVKRTCGNCKSFEKHKTVNLCENDFCGLVGEIKDTDYCSRWEEKV